MELPRCEFRQGPQLPLDTPDPLTCWPTAMTRAIAPQRTAAHGMKASLEENVAALDIQLSDEEFATLDREGRAKQLGT